MEVDVVLQVAEMEAKADLGSSGYARDLAAGVG